MKWLVLCGKAAGAAPYVRWLEAGGIGAVVQSPEGPAPAGADDAAALLLTGGGDVEPVRYGAPAHPRTRYVDRARDELEIRTLFEFALRGRPVYGICRGLQVLNVALGGGLLQHLPDAPGAAGREPHAKGPDGQDARHGLRWVGGTELAAVLGAAAEANSAHHQAADPARLGGGLRVAAFSSGGIVEALESADGPRLSAVQWHPERMTPPGHPAAAALRAYWKAEAAAGRTPRIQANG